MSFRDVFHKYKVLVFVLYALCASIAISFIRIWWINLLIILPMLAFGVVILIDIFPRKKIDYLTAVCADGLGTVQITSRAIVKSVRAATNAIDGVRYVSSIIVNEKSGLSVLLKIKISYSKVMEISEVTRIFVKKVLEKEMNIRVAKIDVIVNSFVHEYKVNKVSVETPEEEKTENTQEILHSQPGVPAYKLKYGEKETTFFVPCDNVLKTREQPPMQPVHPSQPTPEQIEQMTERRVERITETVKVETQQAVISAPSIDIAPAPAAISAPKTESESNLNTNRALTPKIHDAHADIDEVELPITAPSKTRAQQLQEKREETARKYAELKAKQEQRKQEHQ